MITELTYEELNEAQQAQADRTSALEQATSKYLVNGLGQLVGYRLAEMFTHGKPMKWSVPLDIKTGDPMPEPEKVKGAKSKTVVTTAAALLAADPMTGGGRVREITFDLIDRCPMNPRVAFKRERLDELKQSLRAHGFIAEMSHLWVRPSPTTPGRYELVDGERRWIVVGELVRDEGFNPVVPVNVSELSDAQVLEFALINARQREDLSPIEEAVAICRLLEMPKADGVPPTAKEAAAMLGCSTDHITNCRRLRRLQSTKAGAAIEDGRLTIRHGIILGQIASPKRRDELTKRVLEPSDKRGQKAVEVEILQEWVENEVQVDLRAAKFPYEDATLVPLELDDAGERKCGGACGHTGSGKQMVWECPFVDAVKGRALCLNPDCFKAKEAARYEHWRKTIEASGENMKTLPMEEAEKVWDASGVQINPALGYVDLASRPESWELKAEVTAVPTWKKLLKSSGVKILVVPDREGKVRELVPRDIAKQAAREQLTAANEPDIFKGAIVEAAPDTPTPAAEEAGDPRIEAAVRDTKAEEEKARAQQEQARQKLIAERTDLEVHRSLIVASRGLKRLTFEFWRLVLAPMMEAVRESGHLAALCRVLGKSEHLTNDVDNADFLERMVRDTDPVHMPSMALIIARYMLYPNETEQWLKLATKEFGVDPKAHRKTVTAQIEQEEREEAERREIESGVAWMSPLREKVEDFTWLNDGDCSTPNLATLAIPGGKWTVMVGTGRTHKGWHMGYEIRKGVKRVKQTLPNRTSVSYSNPALALKAALLGIHTVLEEAQAPAAAIERINAYAENVKMPDERRKPAAKAKPVKAKKSAKASKKEKADGLEPDEATNIAEDHLLPRARELFTGKECAGVPSLMDALGVGYDRAVRLFDFLVEEKHAPASGAGGKGSRVRGADHGSGGTEGPDESKPS